jgi:hypothetical protein
LLVVVCQSWDFQNCAQFGLSLYNVLLCNTNKTFPHNAHDITEHNLILLKQFYQTQQHKHYRNKIEQNFYQIQSKDTSYIHESVNFYECNPDTDINATEPTIRIMQDKAFIFTNKGNHLITIPNISLIPMHNNN